MSRSKQGELFGQPLPIVIIDEPEVATGEARKRDGIAKMNLSKDSSWLDSILERFVAGFESAAMINSDDVRGFAERIDIDRAERIHGNAWGALFNRAGSRNLLRATGIYVCSSRAKANRRRIQLWRIEK